MGRRGRSVPEGRRRCAGLRRYEGRARASRRGAGLPRGGPPGRPRRPLTDDGESPRDGPGADRDDPRRLPVAPDEEFVHGEPPLTTLFPAPFRELPLEIEFGTGKGRFLIESARLHPGRRFLGIERSLAYYRIARDRIARAGVPNARVLRADASEAVERLPPDSVSAFHAYFLDPWPKKKQRKRRLLGERFLSAASNPARPGALFRIVTDHADYAEAIASTIDGVIAAGVPWRIGEWESFPSPPPTHYELKYRAAGRAIRRFLLVRIS